MSLAMFYHLTRSTPQETMATILPRALSAGWKVMLRGTDDAALQTLDTALWLSPEDSFLPHGLAGGPHDADQPILLGQGAITNAAEGLMLIDGAETTPTEAEALQRVWVLFDGANETALTGARRLWTTLTSAGLAAQYWSEESGRWEKKTEKAAR
ncbi:DNA polymerase III subunit chi [Cypionkella sp.]|uniref:DNA polymerase III subunit chi n=1 Tax=Cypionkella sp. TaxID=2811411 RepID=UPI0026050EA1|nr:DNA polymerase III subunit chi [Cypionkella sp.]